MDEQVSPLVSGRDRISTLPDEIICIILSKLAVEESARTSILSKRWLKMWLLSPISIFDESIVTYSNEYLHSARIVNAMSHVISTHPGPIHTCHFVLYIWDEHFKTLVELLLILTQKDIQNLQIYSDENVHELPFFVLECKSLVEVKLCNVAMRDQIPIGWDIFPNLRKLTMLNCETSDEFLVNLLCSKSIIELTLTDCYDFEEVIDSDSLQKLVIEPSEIDCEIGTESKLIVKDAPNLESFKYYGISKVVILNAPKLKALRCIDMDISMLQLGNYRFKFHKKYMRISGEITYMPSLRSLDIIVNSGRGYEAKTLPHFLMCFPCLETLQVKMVNYPCYDSSSDDNVAGGDIDGDNDDDDDDDDDDGDGDCDSSSGDGDYDSSSGYVVDGDCDSYVRRTSNMNCLHLKNLRVTNYSGRKVHLNLVKLVIMNARVLQTVTLNYDNAFEEKWIDAQRQCLMNDRASEMLKVEFLKGK